jgi:hypothetical protein
MSAYVKGLRMMARNAGNQGHRVRRPKVSREGTRERCGVNLPRTLWGFGRRPQVFQREAGLGPLAFGGNRRCGRSSYHSQ